MEEASMGQGNRRMTMTEKSPHVFKHFFLVLFAMIVVVAFAGCAKQRTWTKKGLQQEEFDKDFAKCTREASSSTQVTNYANSMGLENGLERDIQGDESVKKCMFSKGYKLEDK